MSRPHLVRVIFLVVLLSVGTQAKPLRGGKRSFGMGLLGGALMGGVVGHAVAKSSAKSAAPAAAPVAQVVENGVPDANGCYKQTIKEPVAGHRKLYTETVHLVCPNGLPPATPQHVVPAQAAPVGWNVPAASQPTPTLNYTHSVNATQTNGTQQHTVLLHPRPAAVPAAPAPAHPSGVTVVYAAPPATPIQHAVPAAPPRVVLLSKSIKKQRSAAASLNVSYGLLLLVVFYCLLRN
ncbi:uncharacterized protein LOC117574640 [Drosophila albomicans]|uniref:Uncharacterized protein LOC117574640 n=1 Tax=Drosophila albomicans TaxID=7291 RepID=A0A6P8XN45_DROAB|nr:uncharacterized protein LOC117574640 [Drosophila albomicans]